MAKNEKWGAVKDFVGIYEVSTLGRVRRLISRSDSGLSFVPRILKPHALPAYGYLQVNLCWKNVTTHRYVHRLVLEAFVGPCPDGMECDHKDFDVANNKLGNLEWTTHKENAARAGQAGRRRLFADRDSKIVALVESGFTIREAGRQFGVNYKNAHRIVRG